MNKLSVIQNKIIKPEQLIHLKSVWSLKDQKIVFTNGCFDILHRGHIEYLAQAASFGDILVVGVNSDQSVKRIKSDKRPVQDEYARALAIASLHFVDFVALFNEDTPYELIKSVEPEVLIKGDDYKAEDIVGYDIVKKRGGEVKTIKLIKGYATSKIIEKCQRL